MGAKFAKLVSEERLVFLQREALRRVSREWATDLGVTVRDGPFAGLTYPKLAAAGSAIFPKVIGSYESELHPIIEQIIARDYRRIVNIGAAEGYFAVGFARRMPRTVIEAFEMNEDAHPLLRSMAASNGVSDRVKLHGICTTTELKTLALHNDLLLVDCEGAELILLDPATVPGLESCEMLVEIHTVRGENTGDILASRFRGTHRMTIIPIRPRVTGDYPVLDALPQEDRWAVLHERTDTFGWAWFTPAT